MNEKDADIIKQESVKRNEIDVEMDDLVVSIQNVKNSLADSIHQVIEEDASIKEAAFSSHLSDQEECGIVQDEMAQMEVSPENDGIDEIQLEEKENTIEEDKNQSDSTIEYASDESQEENDTDIDEESEINMKSSTDDLMSSKSEPTPDNFEMSGADVQFTQNYRLTTDYIFELHDKQRMQWHKLRKDWMQQREAEILQANSYNNIQLIDNRVEEIKAMSSKVIRATQFISNLSLHQQDLIKKLQTQSDAEFKQQHRLQWTHIDLIKFAFRMVLLFKRASRPRRKYLEDRGQPSMVEKGSKNGSEKLVFSKEDRSKERCTISSELRLCLLTRPQFRTKNDLQRILFYLRATKPFTHLFPQQMEVECARYVEYESYSDKRILSQQNRTPDRFYYVINGKMICTKQYELSDGVINQNLKILSKGSTTNPKSMEKQRKNQFFLVAEQTVEVLSIHKTTYFYLLNSFSGLPLEFLRSIKLFKKFPCELFYSNLESINVRYYAQNTIVVADSNRTPWLFIVKSGMVKVVRKQNIYSSMEKGLLSSRNVHKISHAKEMLGLTYRQRLLIADSQDDLRLPTLEPQAVANPYSKTLNILESSKMLRSEFRRSRTLLPSGRAAEYRMQMKTDFVRSQTIVSHSTHTEENDDVNRATSSKPQSNDNVSSQRKVSRLDEVTHLTSNENKTQAGQPKMLLYSNSPAQDRDAKIINISRIQFQEDVREQQRKYMTEEKRKLAAVLTGKQIAHIDKRSAMIQLDVLQSGNIFGLHHLEAPLASEPKGLLLISDGAEIIRISKRFFVQQAQNNTLLKIQKQCKIYMSENEAKNDLHEMEIWKQFKSNEINSFVQHLKKSND